MQANEQTQVAFDETVLEIATILARGYMRYRNSRRIAVDSDEKASNAKKVMEFE
jgi:hypothetical protein